MENLKSKISSFRFIIFIITSVEVGGYLFFCDRNKELVPLQGIILGLIALATVLIGGKTLTDIKGKK